MKLFVVTVGGRALADLDNAEVSWRLRNVLAALRRRGVEFEGQPRVLLQSRELKGDSSLGDIGASDGSALTLVMCSPPRICSASSDGTAKVWSSATGRCLHTIRVEVPGTCMTLSALSSDGSQLLTVEDATAKMWSLATEEPRCTHTLAADGKIISAAISPDPDDRQVVIASLGGLAIWSVGQGARTLQNGSYRSAVFSPDGRRVLAVSSTWCSPAEVWCAESGRRLETVAWESGSGRCAVFSPDGLKVLTASDNGTAGIWCSDSRRLLETRQCDGTAALNSARFSPDGRAIVTVAYVARTAKVRSISDEWMICTIGPHDGPVTSATFSPDGQQILTSSVDGTLKLWSVEDLWSHSGSTSGECLRTLEGHDGPVWSASFE